MKYASIRKQPDGLDILVAFPDIVERAEQQLRYSYEFPEGTFVPMSYREARKAYGSRQVYAMPFSCELCAGKAFPATVSAEDAFVLTFAGTDWEYFEHDWDNLGWRYE